MTEKNKPEKKYRSGSVTVDVWKNVGVVDGKAITFKTVTLQRSYKDKEDKWQNTETLRAADVPRAVLLLNKAYEYLVMTQDSEEE